jgi:hypothetical protein
MERLIGAVRTILEARLRGEDVPPNSTVKQLDEFFAARQKTVASLIAEIRKAVPETTLRFSTQSTIAGTIFYTGNHGSEPAAALGRLYGLDYRALENQTDGLVLLGYVRDYAALGAHLDSYVELGVNPERATVVLRPMKVDCVGPEDFDRRLRLVIDRGFRSIHFVHFFARPSEIAMVAKAIEHLV